MKILKFNESNKYDSIFSIPNIDIEDCFVDMTDKGFELKIEKMFIKKDSSPDYSASYNEPITKDSEAWYKIELKRSEDDISLPADYRDSSYYVSDNVDEIKSFILCFSRCKKQLQFDKIFYIIKQRPSVYIKMKDQDMEIGFDMYYFTNTVMSNFTSDWDRRKLNEIFMYDFVYDVSYESYGSEYNYMNYEFNIHETDVYISYIATEVKKEEERNHKGLYKIDNKKLYEPIIENLKILIKKNPKVKIEYEFSESTAKKNYNMKNGMFSKLNFEYQRYSLDIKVRKID